MEMLHLWTGDCKHLCKSQTHFQVGILDILCPRRPLQECAPCQPLEPPSSLTHPDGYSHRWVFPDLQHESPWPRLDSLGRLKHNERTWTIPRMLSYVLSSVLQKGDTSSWQSAGSLLTCSSVFSNAVSAAPEFLRANKIFTVTPAIHHSKLRHSHPFGGGTRRAPWHPGQGHSRWLTWGTHGRRSLFPRAFCCQSSPETCLPPLGNAGCSLRGLADAHSTSLPFSAPPLNVSIRHLPPHLTACHLGAGTKGLNGVRS